MQHYQQGLISKCLTCTRYVLEGMFEDDLLVLHLRIWVSKKTPRRPASLKTMQHYLQGLISKCLTCTRYVLEGMFEDDLLVLHLTVPHQARPEVHPVQPRPVVHHDQAAVLGTNRVSHDLHPHPHHKLHQRLQRENIVSIFNRNHHISQKMIS